jgi:hypothetical protein
MGGLKGSPCELPVSWNTSCVIPDIGELLAMFVGSMNIATKIVEM